MKKVWQYALVILVCFVLILSGIYCAISWFKHAHRTSHVVGHLDVDNSYTQEAFSFSNAKNPIVFYHEDYDETGIYYFPAELPAVPSFDGNKKQYEIELNNYLILEPTILYRAVSFRVYIDFIDVDTSVLCKTYFDILIKFYIDKTEFRMEAVGNENRQFIERYIQANGFELYINEISEGVNNG